MPRKNPGNLPEGSPEPSPDDNEENDDLPQPFNARLVRVVRTQSSESFIIWQDDTRLGQVDIHYGWDIIHATLILETDLSEEDQAGLVELIDEDAVASHLPRFSREDFLVTVFRAEELEPFSDGPDPEELEDDEEF